MRKTKYIYTISHPLTKQIVYVGASVNVEARAKSHVGTTHYYSSCSHWLSSLLKEGLFPVFTIVDKTDEDWRELERKYIVKFFNEGHPILNSQCKGLKLKNEDKFVLIDLTK